MNAEVATQQLFEFLVLKQSKGALKVKMHSLLSLSKNILPVLRAWSYFKKGFGAWAVTLVR